MATRGLAVRLAALTAACVAIGFVFMVFVRPAYLNWGSTAEERIRRLPGDEIAPDAVTQNTRAITIDATVDKVWPWIAQIGQDRGGFYSFDLLENLVGCEMPTTDALRPDKQAWQLGDKLWMYPSHRAGGAGFATLRTLQPGRALGFGTRLVGTSLDEPENGSWTFVIEPAGLGRTRLLIRGRGLARHSLLGVTFDQGFFEPVHFAMERRMMIGLAQLVETGWRDRLWNHIHVALWATIFVTFLAAAVFVVVGRRPIRSLFAFVAAAAVFQILTLLQPPLVAASLLVIAVLLLLRGPGPVSAFKTPRGEATYLAAYDAALKAWPVSYEEIEATSRFGTTYIVACGPRDAPPLVLLHGYWSTLTMWIPNVADLSRNHRVYAIDVMGQPGRSVPGEPVRSAADYVAWLTSTLDALHLDRIALMGMSYGGWLALSYAITTPARVQQLVLLSPAASVLPLVRQFSLRGMLMVFVPTRATVNSFMRWLGFKDNRGSAAVRREGNAVVDLIYLGLKHFRVPAPTARIAPTVFSDTDLRNLRVPVLLLMGDREVIYDPAAALARAERLIPAFEGALVPGCGHDMCVSQHRLVDQRVLEFLDATRAGREARRPERATA